MRAKLICNRNCIFLYLLIVTSLKSQSKESLATFAGGCFWCTEAVFQRLEGVRSVVSGYSGGEIRHPSYKQISTGTTGHAEVIQITFDELVISYEELLAVFFQTHDPTTLNKQGNDVGTQYRSAIFYHTDQQQILAEAYKKKLFQEKVFRKPIVTEISAFTAFYPAEKHHQNYYESNTSQPYCKLVILPKLQKLETLFSEKLKQSNGEQVSEDERIKK